MKDIGQQMQQNDRQCNTTTKIQQQTNEHTNKRNKHETKCNITGISFEKEASGEI